MIGGCAGEQSKGTAGATLDELQGLLQEQLKLVHQGRLAAAEGLCEQAGRLVQAAVAAEMLAGPGGDDRRRSLLRLYQELCLTLTAQRQEVSASLRTVRRGRQMLRTYGKYAS
jgi:hypothetical protein